MEFARVTSQDSKNAVTILVTSGNHKGKEYSVRVNDPNTVKQIPVKQGDEIVVSVVKDIKGHETVYITDYQRGGTLLFLTILFLVVVLAISRIKGLLSLIAMGFSFLILTRFILPQILAGNNPVLISLLGSLLILPASFYISHGISKKTTVSLIGTFIALVITGILSYMFIIAGKITGFASEEALFLQAQGASVDIQSALLAGIIIAAMGILDDVTISQAAVVEKIHSLNKHISFGDLYKNAMDVGRDHISSLVNTLVLVYAGASLPLFLLFYTSPLPYPLILNQEIIATEIIRTLVSSIGIILAVPITTFIASYSYKRS